MEEDQDDPLAQRIQRIMERGEVIQRSARVELGLPEEEVMESEGEEY